MDITVYGIGYVGAVVAGCMSRQGHHVVAVDTNGAKVKTINAGESPLAEPGLAEIIAASVTDGRLSATIDSAAAFARSDVCFVCVGTPGMQSGRPDMTYIVSVAGEIGRLLGTHGTTRRRTIVFRSTMLPGTMDETVVPILERASGLRAGHDFGVGYMPEFLREGQGVSDFDNPATVIIGGSGESTFAVLRALHTGNDAAVFECDFRTAEAIKFANNAWHAVKISFANEIGAICKGAGIDGRRVMEILCADKRLNISPAYMRPGFAFGGSCLPKDLKALTWYAQTRDVRTHVTVVRNFQQ